MAKRLIVVTLDGSQLSEAVIPYATALASATKARLLLATVWESGEELLTKTLPSLAEDLFKRGEAHYEEYLAGVAKRLQSEGVEAEAEVRIGDAAEEIEALLKERAATMLVLASHGRSGLSRWVYGSVAGKLVREAPVPTLVVGPKLLERAAAKPAIHRILVPIDGSGLSEAALEPAVELAEAFGGEIVLAEALRWATQAFVFGVPDIDVATIDQELTKAAEEYLGRLKGSLQTTRPVSTTVLRGLAAEALTDLVDRQKIDLVVMASHARSGIVRAALGSVADRMLQSNAPVLLVRPGAA